ncbi:MAG: family 16 glycoside hydrolase [Planctomycetota bacterium]
MKTKAIASILLLFPTAWCNAGERIFEDRFERSEKDEQVEQPGNGWGTNSKSRAGGNKQVDLADGAMHIYRHATADHGVSVVQDLAFKDATIELRFRIGKEDELGINIADMKEKSVHAGHICAARVRPHQVTLQDLKTGRMKREMRERFQAKKATKADKALVASKQQTSKIKIEADAWHKLVVKIAGETMAVFINDLPVAEFESEGIGHATKSRIRLAVPKQAWVDDMIVDRD